MRYLMIVQTEQSEQLSSRALEIALERLGEEMVEAGVLVGTGSPLPGRGGASLRVSEGRVTIIDRSAREVQDAAADDLPSASDGAERFPQPDVLLRPRPGHTILEVQSKADAVKHARRILQLHADILGPDFEASCELREVTATLTSTAAAADLSACAG